LNYGCKPWVLVDEKNNKNNKNFMCYIYETLNCLKDEKGEIMNEKIRCLICGGKHVIKKGKRKTRYRSRQVHQLQQEKILSTDPKIAFCWFSP